MTHDLIPRFKEHLRKKKFFRPGDRILVACSGGPDSVALFHLLQGLAPAYSWKLGILHYNHQLRPGSANKDERFVRTLAKSARVLFCGGRGNVNKKAKEENASIEEAARKMRYDFFLRAARAERYSKVVFAHTRDDQAETVLMRILQGTGPRGLSGIREKIVRGRVTLLRPLLAFSKKELLSYLAANRFPFRSDESNESLRFLRNRIRLELIPSLQRDYNPRLVETLSRIPAIVAEEDALFSELAGAAWKKTFQRRAGKGLELRRAGFLELPAALQFRVLETALKKLDPQSGLSFDAWEGLRAGLGRSRWRYSLPKDIDFELTPKKIMIYKKRAA